MNFTHRRPYMTGAMRAIIIGASAEDLGMAAIVPQRIVAIVIQRRLLQRGCRCWRRTRIGRVRIWCYCWYHDRAESPKALLE
jgi:hypothetical protein